MHISKFQLRNYKCFDEPAPLELRPGFNIITGQNNAGKTALLSALGLNFTNTPHRSEQTVPIPGASPNPNSWAEVEFTARPAEVLRFLHNHSPGAQWYIAVPDSGSSFAQSIGFLNRGQRDVQLVIDKVFSLDNLTFRLRYDGQAGWSCPEVPTFGVYPAVVSGGNYTFMNFQVRPDLSLQALNGQMIGGAINEFGRMAGAQAQAKVYRFSAERFNIGTSRHGNNPT
jgi:AAA ATPase-like protein